MSRSNFKITPGEVAFVITTNEPVFVKDAGTEYASVVRPVVSTNGIEHREEVFPLNQLETPLGSLKRKMEFEEEAKELQDKIVGKAALQLSSASKTMLNKRGKLLSIEGKESN